MIGERLRLARNRAGMSLRDLADSLDGMISAQAIGKYERNEMTPSSGVMNALCDILDVSMAYFMPSQNVTLTKVDFRKKSTTKLQEQAQVQTIILSWVDNYLQIEHILGMNSAEWNNPIEGRRPIKTLEDAETLAEDVRKNWGLGSDPILNITEVLEENGLKVLIQDFPNSVSGLNCTVSDADRSREVPTIVVNRQHGLERRRLTLAHELAHELIDGSEIDEKFEEKLATRFAGALLMPAAHVRREVGEKRQSFSYPELMELKSLYRVSGAALLVRFRDLGIITPGILTYAFQSIARTWRSTEPQPIEKHSTDRQELPCRFRRLCFRALSEKLISTSKAAELLEVDEQSIKEALKGQLATE